MLAYLTRVPDSCLPRSHGASTINHTFKTYKVRNGDLHCMRRHTPHFKIFSRNGHVRNCTRRHHACSGAHFCPTILRVRSNMVVSFCRPRPSPAPKPCPLLYRHSPDSRLVSAVLEKSQANRVINTICNLLERREVGGDRVGKSAVSRLYIGQSDKEGYGNRVAAK